VNNPANSARVSTVGTFRPASARWNGISGNSRPNPSRNRNTSAFNGCFCVLRPARLSTASALRKAPTSRSSAVRGDRGAMNRANRAARAR